MMAKSTTCHKCKKGRPVKKEGMARQLVCQHCHKEFRSATGKAKYCSTDCHNEAKGRIPTGRVKGICLDCGQPISHVALRCAKCAYIHKVASRVVPNNGSALQRAMVRMLKGEETENDLAIIDQHDTINEEERIFKQAIKAEQILAKLGVPSSKYFNCYRGVKR
jgi:hypothetical protein